MAERLAAVKTRHSYRFVFTPGTIRVARQQ
jgi:aminopeptidase-like protein